MLCQECLHEASGCGAFLMNLRLRLEVVKIGPGAATLYQQRLIAAPAAVDEMHVCTTSLGQLSSMGCGHSYSCCSPNIFEGQATSRFG